jgi:uncharacterized protein
MRRLLMDKLVSWKTNPNRKPLLLRGARQTGKTWLMEEFAAQEFQDSIKIDFMFDEQARTLFEQDLDPKRIIRQIELRQGRAITPSKTLLIFDEIQEVPRGITSLKYFCEQAREYHVIAAGSYMGVALRRNEESFPVGKVDQLTLRPLCFSEFVRATAGEPLADALEAASTEDLVATADMLERLLKEYLIVGGMPEIVEAYRSKKDAAEARRLQLGILESYDADFSKHAPERILERMRLVWKSLPGQLARENKKFVYGTVRPGARARDFEESLQWLADYGAVSKVPRAGALHTPLLGYEDVSAFKLFSIDVGLLGAQAGLDPAVVLDGSHLFTEFKGAMVEQYVEQELRCLGYEPAYWSAEKGTAETDFCIPFGGTVLPIEVKAGENLRSKSLRVACEKFKLETALRTSLSPYRHDGWLVNVPLWAVGQFEKLMSREG